MKRRGTAGTSASFLDLLCCALGGIILLVVLFSVKLKPGEAIETVTFTIVEFTFKLPSGTSEDLTAAIAAADERGLSITFVDDPSAPIEYERTPVVDETNVCWYRWITNLSLDATGSPVIRVHAVLTDFVRPVTIRARGGQSSGVTVSYFTNRTPPAAPTALESVDPFDVKLIEE